jgi:hypothetical protein
MGFVHLKSPYGQNQRYGELRMTGRAPVQVWSLVNDGAPATSWKQASKRFEDTSEGALRSTPRFS